MDLAQGMVVQFGHDETAVTGKAAAVDAGRLHDFPGAGVHDFLQLRLRAALAHSAVDVESDRTGLPYQPQSRQQCVVGEFVKVQQRQACGQMFLHAHAAGAGIHDDGVAPIFAGCHERSFQPGSAGVGFLFHALARKRLAAAQAVEPARQAGCESGADQQFLYHFAELGLPFGAGPEYAAAAGGKIDHWIARAHALRDGFAGVRHGGLPCAAGQLSQQFVADDSAGDVTKLQTQPR